MPLYTMTPMTLYIYKLDVIEEYRVGARRDTRIGRVYGKACHSDIGCHVSCFVLARLISGIAMKIFDA